MLVKNYLRLLNFIYITSKFPVFLSDLPWTYVVCDKSYPLANVYIYGVCVFLTIWPSGLFTVALVSNFSLCYQILMNIAITDFDSLLCRRLVTANAYYVEQDSQLTRSKFPYTINAELTQLFLIPISGQLILHYLMQIETLDFCVTLYKLNILYYTLMTPLQ